MNKIIIRMDVSDNQAVSCRDKINLLTNSKCLYYLRFSFSALWTGNIHCQLKKGKFKADYAVTGDVLIPKEMTETEGQISVSVYTENLITSSAVKLNVIPSEYDNTLSERPQDVPVEGENYVKTFSGENGVSKLKNESGNLLFWDGKEWILLKGDKPAVYSVNGKKGDVLLSADDVGAVAKAAGKGLSSNDYTDTDKQAVSEIPKKADTEFTNSKPQKSGIFECGTGVYTPYLEGAVFAANVRNISAMLYMCPEIDDCETYVYTANNKWIKLLTEKDAAAFKPPIENLISSPLKSGSLYLLGTVSQDMTLSFPSSAEKGDFVYAAFEVGTQLPVITVDKTNTIGLEDLVFEGNTYYELHGLFDGTKWVFVINETVIL